MAAAAAPIGFARMDGAGSFEQLVPPGLAALGIETDEVDLAVMHAAHEQFWPAIEGLLALDLTRVPDEVDQDLSRPPADK
jgi:hypothetical protein